MDPWAVFQHISMEDRPPVGLGNLGYAKYIIDRYVEMPAIRDIAHDVNGNAVQLGTQLELPPVPSMPSDDYRAASKAVWRLALNVATLRAGDAFEAHVEIKNDKRGIWWEGYMKDVCTQLWPDITKQETLIVMHRFKREEKGLNIINMVNGRRAPSLWWVALEYTEPRQSIIKTQAAKAAVKPWGPSFLAASTTMAVKSTPTEDLVQALAATVSEALEQRTKLVAEELFQLGTKLQDIADTLNDLAAGL